MAIQKTKTLSNGATGNYWKIISEVYDKVTLQSTYIIALFTDKAHSDAGNPSLGLNKTYIFTFTRLELQGNRTLLGYTSIKAKAASMVLPISGKPGDTLIQFDPDLVGGIDV